MLEMDNVQLSNKNVFISGSCRLHRSIFDGRKILNPIHSMFHNFFGINFLGKLHNTRQHIQFIKWLKMKNISHIILCHYF